MHRSVAVGLCIGLLLLVGNSRALAQLQPTGGGDYFGAPSGQSFSADGVFGKPPPPKPAPKLPDTDAGLMAKVETPPPKIWRGSLDAGFNGATGNSDVFNARLGWNADRKTETNLLHADFLYTLGKQEERTIQNVAILNARDEILFPGSRCSIFSATNIEYDELRSYRFRVGVYAGAGYRLIDNDRQFLKLRAGAGAVREIGGPRDRWVPEFVFGYDSRVKISDRQSIVSVLDYYPRVDNFGMFRVRARMAYEIIIDPESALFLRLGTQSRYDSDPGPGFRRYDLNFFASLGMSF